jgi:hypothetical protein
MACAELLNSPAIVQRPLAKFPQMVLRSRAQLQHPPCGASTRFPYREDASVERLHFGGSSGVGTMLAVERLNLGELLIKSGWSTG